MRKVTSRPFLIGAAAWLLASTVPIAATNQSPDAKADRLVLYSQLGETTQIGAAAQDFGQGQHIQDCQGADDFVVFAAEGWEVHALRIVALYAGNGPASEVSYALHADLEGSPGIVLEGPMDSLGITQGVICSVRHIHMSPEDALSFGLKDRDICMVRVEGDRTLIFGDVLVRVNPDYRLAMHIDTDEANAANIRTGMIGHLVSVQDRR